MSDFEPSFLAKDKILDAYQRISQYLMKTPVHISTTVDGIVKKKVFFKCENFQKTGSFKARGALNAVLRKISQSENIQNYTGIVTHSSGNHGTALSWACQTQAIPCTVVVPKDTPLNKIESIKTYGATLEICEPNPRSRVEVADRLAAENRLLLVKPYDDYDIMAGQGTVAVEFLEQIPDLDAILVSVSGGGLISGISTYAKSINPSIRIFAVEPVGKRLCQCLEKNKRNLDDKEPAFLNTKAEGIKTEMCGELTFPIISRHILPDDVFTVTDDDMIEATKFIFKRMKMVIELSAGAAVAAVLSDKMKNNYPSLKNIGVILCGGNIDIDNLPW
ncbi:serine racemase [Brachionus plicatilis]|uniref:Serine racemase n=1 Tax=Brachionus plicatilis TaxID=10195 RepID=A0A3M7S8M3_BRAPC|nr:serine racemase [Brachionus plicatilis]